MYDPSEVFELQTLLLIGGGVELIFVSLDCSCQLIVELSYEGLLGYPLELEFISNSSLSMLEVGLDLQLAEPAELSRLGDDLFCHGL